MKQAIRIRRLPATKTKPSRLSIRTTGGAFMIKSVEYFDRIADKRKIGIDNPYSKIYLCAAILMCERINLSTCGMWMTNYNNEIYVTFPQVK